MRGSNISAEIFEPQLQMMWSVILIALGIKYFRGVQKFQAKVVRGPLFRGSKYIATGSLSAGSK